MGLIGNFLRVVGGAGGAPGTCCARLTTESGVPVSASDRTAQATLYLTPFRGNTVALYGASGWVSYALAEVSLALSGLTSGKNYDVFLYSNAGTLTLALSAAWSSDTARADALALQDGAWVKSADHTRLYVGTIRTTGTTTTEDSAAKRFVWNAYNRVRRHMAVADTTDSWTYSTATWRQANGAAGNQLDYVAGLAEDAVEAAVHGIAINDNSPRNFSVGVGVDSTSANSAQTRGQNSSTSVALGVEARWLGQPGIGRHTLVWLEIAEAVGTTTWFGDNGGTIFQSGITGSLLN